MKRIWMWLRKHFKIGIFNDMKHSKECNPNEPCRDVEPRETKGARIDIKF